MTPEGSPTVSRLRWLMKWFVLSPCRACGGTCTASLPGVAGSKLGWWCWCLGRGAHHLCEAHLVGLTAPRHLVVQAVPREAAHARNAQTRPRAPPRTCVATSCPLAPPLRFPSTSRSRFLPGYRQPLRPSPWQHGSDHTIQRENKGVVDHKGAK